MRYNDLMTNAPSASLPADKAGSALIAAASAQLWYGGCEGRIIDSWKGRVRGLGDADVRESYARLVADLLEGEARRAERATA
jgi:hypothetical protein